MRRFVVLFALLVVLGGCGSEPGADRAATATATRTPSATATPQPTATPVRPDVQAAEQAAREELPDIPLWKDTHFRGTVTGETRTAWTASSPSPPRRTLGGSRRSHVVVSWPQLTVGKPKDGPCAKATENADKAVDASRRFFLRTDNDALALDDAVKAAQDGDSGALQRIRAVRGRIADRLNRYLLDGGDTSVGANLLLSAATTAQEAARDGDQARLADQRREIADALRKLAEEATS